MITEAQSAEFADLAMTIRVASNITKRELDLATAVETLLREIGRLNHELKENSKRAQLQHGTIQAQAALLKETRGLLDELAVYFDHRVRESVQPS